MDANAASALPGVRTTNARVAPAWLGGVGLSLPALTFLAVFFVVPAGLLLSYSVMTQHGTGQIGAPLTAKHYTHLAQTSLYTHVLLVTLRISLWTAALSVLLGYPMALVIVRGSPWVSRLTTIVLVAPLVVSVVVRTYGWQLLLANSRSGVVNWALWSMGFGPAALKVLYTETAVVIGSLHVFPAANGAAAGRRPRPHQAGAGGSGRHPRRTRLARVRPRHPAA